MGKRRHLESAFVPGKHFFFGLFGVILFDAVGFGSGQHRKIVSFIRFEAVAEAFLTRRIGMGDRVVDELHGLFLFAIIDIVQSGDIRLIAGSIFSLGRGDGFQGLAQIAGGFDAIEIGGADE